MTLEDSFRKTACRQDIEKLRVAGQIDELAKYSLYLLDWAYALKGTAAGLLLSGVMTAQQSQATGRDGGGVSSERDPASA